jgi:hypothetical protein
MITTLRLKFGKGPGASAETIHMTPVTVFVGPNNAGESKVLSEIHHLCSGGHSSATDVIVDGLEFREFTETVAEEKVARAALPPRAAESVRPDYVVVGKGTTRCPVPRRDLVEALKNPNSAMGKDRFCPWYLQFNTLMLGGKSRIGLVDQQPAGDLQQPSNMSFQVLFRDDAKRAEVRRIVHEAFGSYFAIDPTHLGNLRLRLSPRAPASPIEERGIHNEAVQFHAQALPIEQSSDGVKAFTGIITEIIAGDPAILLIDEPEAFLEDVPILVENQ